ncbi:hypothetical protein LZ32DRAFT_218903 [Colletotrichum eremochloae]|nr:hypothetical protein LZ32DRAFT_218903 [Colletotrichum eremochloae]
MAPTCSAISATPSSKKRKRCVHFPDEGSLYNILRTNARLRLFVKPIRWTDFHLDCLGARFIEVHPCDTPVPPTSSKDTSLSYHREPTKLALDLSKALTDMLRGKTEPRRTKSIRNVISQLYSSQLSCIKSTGVHHYFGHRAYLNTCRLEAAWEAAPSRRSSVTPRESGPTSSSRTFDTPTEAKTTRTSVSNQCILAYVDTRTVDAARRSTYRVVGDNGPVKELNKLYHKAFSPLNAHQDPFLAGVILALAQKRFYGETMPSAAEPSCLFVATPPFKAEFHDVVVHILTVEDKDRDLPCFVVYKGVVTEALLRKFHYPAENPQPTEKANGMRIEYTRVPIWPLIGLKERLGKALGADLVGNFDEDNIETWGMDARANDGRPKRRRSGEVQTGSHDETSRCRKRTKYTKAKFVNGGRSIES